MVKDNIITKNFDLFIVFLFVIWPVLINDYAIWDGAIISTAIDNNRLDIISNWFNEAGMPSVVPMIGVAYYFSNAMNIDSNTVMMIYISLCIMLTYLCVIKIVKQFVEVDNVTKIILAIIYSALPFWPVFLSSVFVHWIVPILFCLFSVYLLMRKQYVLSLFVFLLSFDLKINLIFHLFIVSFIVSLFYKQFDKDDLLRFLCFYIVSFSLFFLKDYIFRPYGLYAGYNKANFDLFFNFFVDRVVWDKIVYLSPIVVFFVIFTSVRTSLVFIASLLGLIGSFYLGGKVFDFFIVDFKLYNVGYNIRFDIPLYLFVFIAFSLVSCQGLSLKIKFICVIVFVLITLPLRYAITLNIAKELSSIEYLYKNIEYSDNTAVILQNKGVYYEYNYHLQKASNKCSIISDETISYMPFISLKKVYMEKYGLGCIDLDSYNVVKINNSKSYSWFDLWL